MPLEPILARADSLLYDSNYKYELIRVSSFVLGCGLVLYIGRQTLASRNSYPLPPGPPGLPFVGNVIGINNSAPWVTYADWARMYGDIVHSKLMGKDIIIINSENIAKDLMERRSRNYSDRPFLITNDLYGIGFTSGLTCYGDRWRLHKRFFHQTFRLDAVPRFLPVLHNKAGCLLQQLFDTPERLNDHVIEYTAAIMLKTTYDYEVTSPQDEIVSIVANVMNIVLPAIRPDVSIILDTFPFLLNLLSWFPGMFFKRDMEMARAATKVYLDRPFEYSLRKLEMPSDSIAPSMVRDGLRIIEQKGTLSNEFWMESLKEATGTAFVASETSTSVMMTFFLMMMLNSDAQEKAQAQIDAVVGTSRLPGTGDRASLPFVDAIFRETLRYSPILPLLIPHVSMEDDVYAGFHIPKGALLLANVWSMAHDESRYPKTHAFIPERFLNDDGSLKPTDIEYITFGFGRRMCIGKHFADAAVWGVIVRVLAVFKILKPLGENGAEITIEPKFSSGLVIHPLPFKCRIIPRFPEMDAKKLEELIATSVP